MLLPLTMRQQASVAQDARKRATQMRELEQVMDNNAPIPQVLLLSFRPLAAHSARLFMMAVERNAPATLASLVQAGADIHVAIKDASGSPTGVLLEALRAEREEVVSGIMQLPGFSAQGTAYEQALLEAARTSPLLSCAQAIINRLQGHQSAYLPAYKQSMKPTAVAPSPLAAEGKQSLGMHNH